MTETQAIYFRTIFCAFCDIMSIRCCSPKPTFRRELHQDQQLRQNYKTTKGLKIKQ